MCQDNFPLHDWERVTEAERKQIMAIVRLVRQEFNGFLAVQYAVMLCAYTIRFRQRFGLQAMTDYITWGLANGHTPLRLVATIGHDLGALDDDLLEPRTLQFLGVPAC